MLYAMFLAHLLGDYLLQWGVIARWKARSLVGVTVHGGIVTLATLMCTMLVDPSWWPYALLIGLTHTAIDLVRARFLRTADTAREMVWYMLDQLAHLTVIVLTVTWSEAPMQTDLSGIPGPLTGQQVLVIAIGYILLTNPTWVLVRFTVRGVWGPDAAPSLDEGGKYGLIVERVLIATCLFTGQFYLAPLVLLPRRLVPIRVQGRGVGVLVKPVEHWAETALSVLLATGIGLTMRMIIMGN